MMHQANRRYSFNTFCNYNNQFEVSPNCCGGNFQQSLQPKPNIGPPQFRAFQESYCTNGSILPNFGTSFPIGNNAGQDCNQNNFNNPYTGDYYSNGNSFNSTYCNDICNNNNCNNNLNNFNNNFSNPGNNTVYGNNYCGEGSNNSGSNTFQNIYGVNNFGNNNNCNGNNDFNQNYWPLNINQNNSFCGPPPGLNGGDGGDVGCVRSSFPTAPPYRPFSGSSSFNNCEGNTYERTSTNRHYSYHILNCQDSTHSQRGAGCRRFGGQDPKEVLTYPTAWKTFKSAHAEQELPEPEELPSLQELLQLKLKGQQTYRQSQSSFHSSSNHSVNMNKASRHHVRMRGGVNQSSTSAASSIHSTKFDHEQFDMEREESPPLITIKAPARHSKRPTLRNLNPLFRKREKEEDDEVLSQKLLKNARRSGVLNLSNRGLATVPSKVFDINESDPDVAVSLEGLTVYEEDAWWNQIPLNNLDLSSNQLTQISNRLEKLTSLTCLSLYDNALTEIPPEIGKLEHLVRLNLSRNHLKDLPRELFTLPNLRYLNLAYNEFEELNPDISDLHMLEILDVSNNRLNSLPCGIGFLVKMTTLLLSFNCLKELPADIVDMRNLQKLDLTHNDLARLPENMGSLRKLQFLYLRHNDIVELPMFEGCCNLQELYVSNNYLEFLPSNFYTELPNLKILDLRDNRIKQISDGICLLQGLVRLDISNNALTHLPSSLSALAHLVNLQVEGNPIRNIRSDILQCGTQRILRVLRGRATNQSSEHSILSSDSNTNTLQSNSSTNMGGDGLNSPRSSLTNPSEDSIFPDKFKLRKTHCLVVTMQQLTDVPPEVFEVARQENANIVDFSKNRLATLPESLQLMRDVATELTFANNLISYVPPFISQFSRIYVINLSCNNLSDLPKEFGALQTLRELNISHNRFECLPSCVYQLSGLEILLARDNRIKGIDASETGLAQLKRLATLDLRNNDIEQVPPILGNLQNITTLEIVGNPFKLPRHQILEKGTMAIMSYLRDRIPA